MNNAKMWLVVNPTVGVPLILGAVAVGSFAVHLAVVSNTSWVSDFISGQPMGAGDAMETSALQVTPEVSQASYTLPTTSGGLEIQIKMPDGSTTTGILKLPEVHASADMAPVLEITQ